MPERQFTFGFPEQWKEFATKYPAFDGVLQNLVSLMDVAVGSLPPNDIPSRIIHQLGRECGENFLEILLLRGNGYGHAAWREVRSMYEKAVTANHLMQNPEDAARFQDWHKVTKRKVLQVMKSTAHPLMPSAAEQEKIEAEFLAVKEQFMMTDCGKCGTKRMSISWSKKPFADMAKDAGDLALTLVPAYYEALLYSHPSFFGVLDRLDGESEGYDLDYGPQNEQGDRAFRTAHAVLLAACAQQITHFAIADAEELVSNAVNDFNATWQSNHVPSASGY